jgi:hypothetical protein
MENKKLSVFDKLNCVFNKEPLTKEEFGRDGYMLLRFLSMKPEYAQAINKIQKYQGVLGHRLLILMQHLFSESDKAPFLDMVKKEGGDYKVLSKESLDLLRELFKVDKKRLSEYLGNLYCTNDDLVEVFGER